MIIIDADGAERDWEWVKEKYNLPPIVEAPRDKDRWEVVELKEVIGPMAITITTLDIGSTLVGGIQAWVSWPDGHAQLRTRAEGYVDFIMGRPAAYRPWEGEVGSYYISIWDSGESDTIKGLGWLGKTDHAHLNPTFQFMMAEKPEPPPPPPVDCEEYISALEKIREIVDDLCPGALI